MDSKAVNAELRAQIRPVLKRAGFSRFTERSAWRYHDDRIDVINFQSFNSYLASGLGSTTYSFAIHVGCAFTHIPRTIPFTIRKGLPTPAEYECDVRRSLQKTIDQPELSRRAIWYIDETGKNLRPVVGDAKAVLIDEALPWFDRFSDTPELLRTLLDDPQSMEGTWGFGGQASPIRAYLIGYTALALGERTLAREYLARLVERGGTLATEQVRRDLAAVSDEARRDQHLPN